MRTTYVYIYTLLYYILAISYNFKKLTYCTNRGRFE